MNKIQNIQALRGIAVLAVVLFHLMTIEQKYGGTQTILPDFFNFGMFGVDLFFVISGFVMIAVTRGKFQNLKQATRFIYHRASRIYPTYWFYSLLVLGVFLFKPTLVNSSQGNEVNILASFLLLPSEKLPLVMVGWTLIHEMYFYLIYFIFLLLVAEKHLIKALVSWGVVIVAVNIYFELSSPIEKLIFHPLTIEFVMGCFLGIYFFRATTINKSRNSLLFLAAFSVFIASVYGHNLYQSYTGHTEPQNWWRVLIFGLPAITIVFCFLIAERNGFTIHSSIASIGDASYSIYLSHILTLSAAGRVWSEVSLDSVLDNLVILPALMILAIAVGMFSFRYIEKPLLFYCRKIA